METTGRAPFTLKQILQENWDRYLALYRNEVEWYMALNVWKVINCREPDGLGFATFACSDHPDQICHVPRSCMSIAAHSVPPPVHPVCTTHVCAEDHVILSEEELTDHPIHKESFHA